MVLAAHDACIDYISSGVEYQDIHLLAARVMAAGLVDLGILRGNVDDLVEMDAHALFFCARNRTFNRFGCSRYGRLRRYSRSRNRTEKERSLWVMLFTSKSSFASQYDSYN